MKKLLESVKSAPRAAQQAVMFAAVAVPASMALSYYAENMFGMFVSTAINSAFWLLMPF